eukprot:9786458-Alexandrium_andersonii.AAC.1
MTRYAFWPEDAFSPAAVIAALRERADLRAVGLGPRNEVNRSDRLLAAPRAPCLAVRQFPP